MASAEHRLLGPDPDQSPHERVEVVIPCWERPVVPAEIVVLAVGVVVAALGAADLIAAEEHRRALRQKEGGEKVPLLPGAHGQNLRVRCRAFLSIVARDVVVGTVSILLAIGPIVLVVVGDKVAQGEAVVCSHEVDAGEGLPPVRLVEVGGASEAIAHVGNPAVVTAPEVTRAIAVFSVPFGPAGGKSANVVAVLADIPWLRDQLHLG